MKNNKLKVWLALVVLIAILIPSLPTYASTRASISAKDSIEVGQTLTVSVNIYDVPNLSTLGFDLKFDSAAFSYVSGSVIGEIDGGSKDISLVGSNTVVVQAEQCIIKGDANPKATFKFKAIKAASGATFSVNNIVMADLDVKTISAAGNSKTVTVTEPIPKSKNADLKSLTIAPGPLTPAFRSDNNSYSVTVGETTKSLAVDAQAADAKAQKVDISGHTNLKPGLNTVKIVVTAESGATKTYTIKVTRTAAAPTLAATPTPAPSPTPELSPTPATSPTPAPTIKIDDTTMTVAPLAEGTNPPAGFSEASINVEGQTLPAYVSQSGGITLVYLANSAGTTAYYVYDAAAGSFAPYRSITIPARSYVLLPADDLTAPAGYKAATVTISGQTINGFQAEKADAANGQAILVYLMSDSGTKQLYAWNEKAGELSRFVPPVPEGNSPTPAPSGEPTGAVAGPVGNDNDPGNIGGTGNTSNGMFGLILVIVGLAALSVMLGGILLYQRFAGRRRKGYGRMQAPPIRRVDDTLN